MDANQLLGILVVVLLLGGTAAADEPSEAAGTKTVISGTYPWDFESNSFTQGPADDMQWGIASETSRYIQPSNGALWAVITDKDYADVDRAYLQALPLSDARINDSDDARGLAPGTLLGCKTAEGNYVKAIVTGYDAVELRGGKILENQNLKLTFTLYEGADSVSVVCEVWRSDDEALVAELEALTDKSPDDAAAIRTRLQASDGKAKRTSRFVTTTASGKPVTQEDLQDLSVQVERPGGGRGFGGFVQTGARLRLTATIGADDRIKVEFDIAIAGVIDETTDAPIPPGRLTSKIKGTVTVPSDGIAMFQSNTHKADTTYVFLKVALP